MAEKGFKRFLPALIPLIMEVMRRMKRDRIHDKEIEKIDQTQEKLSTLENLMVKMEKKSQTNREQMDKKLAAIKTFLIVNTILLLVVLLATTGFFPVNCP